jgi:alanine-glyoxylate transaminase/serine-glyoxylate transaminase/serine-pyruvate transaminase
MVLHEALRLGLLEGLENRGKRHAQNHHLLKEGLAEFGLEIVSQAGHQPWQLNAVGVPAGADELAVCKQLLKDYQIEIGAGRGPLKGKIWRIGLMGETSKKENAEAVLGALKSGLKR